MFPLILAVLNRDYNRGYYKFLLRTVREMVNIPSSGFIGSGESRVWRYGAFTARGYSLRTLGRRHNQVDLF